MDSIDCAPVWSPIEREHGEREDERERELMKLSDFDSIYEFVQ